MELIVSYAILFKASLNVVSSVPGTDEDPSSDALLTNKSEKAPDSLHEAIMIITFLTNSYLSFRFLEGTL